MTIALVVFFLILYCSFYISNRAYESIKKIDGTKNIFFGNSSFLAINSNIGSVFTLSLFCSLVALTFKMELHAIPLLIGSALLSLLVLFVAIKKIYAINSIYNENNLLRSSLDYFRIMFGVKSALLIGWFYIILFTISISLELSIFNYLIKVYFVDDIILSRILTFMLISVCLMYVYIGSYLGVLKTDTFQLFVIIVALIMINYALYDYLLHAGLDIAEISRISFSNFEKINYDHNNLLNTIFQIVILVFVISMWFIAMPDFWIRNIGTLKSENDQRKAIKRSVIFLMPLAVMIIIFAFYLKTIFAWSSDSEAPFYSLMKFIGVLISKKEMLGQTEDIFHNMINGTVNQFILIVCTFALFTLILLTTLNTFLITTAQLRSIMKSYTKQNIQQSDPRAFVFIVGAIASVHTILLQKSIFAGWGTFAASLFLYKSSVMFTALIIKNPKDERKVFYSLISSFVVFLSTIIIAWNYHYLMFISMHSVLCALYILPFPLLVLFISKKT